MSTNGEQGFVPSPLATARMLTVIVIVSLAWAGAFLLRFDGAVPPDRIAQFATSLPLVLLIQLIAHQLAGASRHSWRYTTLYDLVPVMGAVVAAGAVLGLIRTVAPSIAERWPFLDWLSLPYGVIGAYTILAILGLVGVRALRRVVAEQHEIRLLDQGEDVKRVLLLGAGRAGVLVARELQSRPDLGLLPVGFVDDDPKKQGRRITQLDVLGGSQDLERLVEEHAVDEIVITIASASGSTMRRLVERCEEADRRPMVIPGIYEIVGGQVSLNWFRPVELADLLGRDEVELDQGRLHELLTNQVVVVTGAGGSIGAELARQAARFSPRQLVLVERSEPAMWTIHRELLASHPDVELVPALADVGDRARMERVLLAHRPAVIFHAAAHKHVPMMEDNPGEAIKNNVLGTRTLVDLAVAHGVGRFVLISTDKAVNPTSVMGATKRLAERYVQHVAGRTGLAYVSVRFGNVLGSAGSVVPIFEEQIASGGPVTVTHPDMCRYFMTIPEASQLVLQAGSLGRSGEVLVLDMGEPVRIVELAESMIRLSGLDPYEDVDIEFTGLRPGEKLYEELSLSEEGVDATRHPKIFVGHTATPDWAEAEADIAQLEQATDRLGPGELRTLLTQRVPEYTPEPVGHGDLPPPSPAAAETAER